MRASLLRSLSAIPVRRSANGLPPADAKTSMPPSQRAVSSTTCETFTGAGVKLSADAKLPASETGASTSFSIIPIVNVLSSSRQEIDEGIGEIVQKREAR